MNKKIFEAMRKAAANYIIQRSFRVDNTSYDEKTRSIGAVAITQNPVLIYDMERWEPVMEILFMDGAEFPDNKQVPFIDSHDRSSLRNAFGSARQWLLENVTPPQYSCRVFFDSTQDGKDIEIKYKEGHLTDVSAGYRWLETYYVPSGQQMEFRGQIYKGPIRLTPKFQVRELSGTIVGADGNTGTRSLPEEIKQMLVEAGLDPNASQREAIEFLHEQINDSNLDTNKQGDTNMNLHGRKIPLLDPEPGAHGGAAPEPKINVGDVQRAERERVTAINAYAEHFANDIADMSARRENALNKNFTVQDFAAEVIGELAKRSAPVNPSKEIEPGNTSLRSLGVDIKDLKGFSIVRAINDLSNGKKLSGIEGDLHRHIVKMTKREENENKVIIPNELIFNQRALEASTFAKGGALIGTDVMTDETVELLRNKTYVEELGVRTLSGLVGNVAIPKIAGGATVYWLAEGVDVTLSDQSFGQVAATPKQLMAATAYTKQLLAQTGFGVEAFVRQDILTAMKIEKDRVALNGKGAQGEPNGILNLSGLSTSVTFGAAATWAKILEFETNVATSNADAGSLGYLTTPAARGKWKAIQKAASLGFIWENGNIVNGYNARATNQMPSNLALFGNWNDALFCEWAGIDITVDPLTLAGSGKVKIVIGLMLDFIVRHPASFAKSTDSAAQ